MVAVVSMSKREFDRLELVMGAPVRGATARLREIEAGEVVSIHAPVRGATADGGDRDAGRAVSIHAPVRGATGMCGMTAVLARVSIHAPVRGATAAVIVRSSLDAQVSIHAPVRELWPNLGDDGVRKAAYRGGWKPA